MYNQALKLKSHRIKRIGISFLVSFILINVFVDTALPSYNDLGRASEVLLDDNVCNFADKDFRDIEGRIDLKAGKNIFLLGDSVSYGIGVERESQAISGYLDELYPHRVFNLSSCGSKPLDYYLWLRYLNEVLERNDDEYIIQYNYKWFNTDNGQLEDRISQKRILYHFIEYLDKEINEKLQFNPNLFEDLGVNLSKSIPVSSNKVKIFAAIFNEKSKEDFVEHLFYGRPETQDFEYKKKYWADKKEMRAFNCKIDYSKSDWDPEKNFNYYIYLKTLDYIEENELTALVFLPPYNNELIKKCKNENFDENVGKFLNEASTRNVPAYSFVDLIDEGYFLDDMHLNPEGNRILSEEISQKGLT